MKTIRKTVWLIKATFFIPLIFISCSQFDKKSPGKKEHYIKLFNTWSDIINANGRVLENSKNARMITANQKLLAYPVIYDYSPSFGYTQISTNNQDMIMRFNSDDFLIRFFRSSDHDRWFKVDLNDIMKHENTDRAEADRLVRQITAPHDYRFVLRIPDTFTTDTLYQEVFYAYCAMNGNTRYSDRICMIGINLNDHKPQSVSCDLRPCKNELPVKLSESDAISIAGDGAAAYCEAMKKYTPENSFTACETRCYPFWASAITRHLLPSLPWQPGKIKKAINVNEIALFYRCYVVINWKSLKNSGKSIVIMNINSRTGKIESLRNKDIYTNREKVIDDDWNEYIALYGSPMGIELEPE